MMPPVWNGVSRAGIANVSAIMDALLELLGPILEGLLEILVECMWSGNRHNRG